MDLSFLTEEQLEKTLRLSDILSIEDLNMAAAVLMSFDWDMEKALSQSPLNKIPSISNPSPKKEPQTLNTASSVSKYQQNQQQIYEYNDDDENYYQYENNVNQHNLLAQKKRMFQQEYATLIPLQKCLSEPNKQLTFFQYHKILAKNSKAHRNNYMTTVMQTSKNVCKSIIQKSGENKAKYEQNKRKIQNNLQFINFLYKNYRPIINFTFGTFFLNLTRSYLEEKRLLVYIHSVNPQTQAQFQRLTTSIFRQKEIAYYVNQNCITYGMFDNSDDYQILQKYIPLKQLPAFALFNLNKNKRQEQFISSYSIATSEGNLLQWLASNLGIFLKKKEKEKVEQQNKKQKQYISHDYIREQQDEMWHQMGKMQNMKRALSKQKKQQIQNNQHQLQQKRKELLQLEQPAQGQNVIEIRFRMPASGESKHRRFNLSDKISILFKYVDCFYRQQFEQKFCDFDLKQSFPPISLRDAQDKTIDQVFEGSRRENIIIREL